jgi:hypothetical protein
MNDEKLTLEETLEAVQTEHQDFEDVKAILAMSSQELDKALEEKGFDVAGLEARMAAREAEIRREQDRARRWGWLVRFRALITAFLMILAAAGTHLVDVWRMAAPAVSNLPLPAFAAPPDVRAEAFTECGKMQWQSCLQKLDEAAKVDPDGDKDPEVQKLRAFARRQLQ